MMRSPLWTLVSCTKSYPYIEAVPEVQTPISKWSNLVTSSRLAPTLQKKELKSLHQISLEEAGGVHRIPSLCSKQTGYPSLPKGYQMHQYGVMEMVRRLRNLFSFISSRNLGLILKATKTLYLLR